MKDQHTKIKGYRDLTQAEIDMMNRIKEQAEATGKLCEDLKTMVAKDGGVDPDGRWLAIGITNLQQGFMAITRSVAKPTTF